MKAEKSIKVTSIIIAIVVVLLLILLVVDFTEPLRYEIDGDVLKIKSVLYSKEISLHNAEITVEEERVEFSSRLAGTSIGKVKKGKFSLRENARECYAFLINHSEPCIKIENENGLFFINAKSQNETEELLEKLLER